MNKTLAGLLVLAATVSNAATFAPVMETRGLVPAHLIDVRERTALEIKARAAAGYRYATVDMDGASWKVENQIMKELQAQGYTVAFANDKHHYGWNSLNGALFVKWQ